MPTEPLPSTTPYSGPLIPLIPEVDYLYFTTILTCFLVGTTGNTIALRYFLTKPRDIPTSIYIFISVVDITVSVLVLPLALPYVSSDRYGYLLETSDVFCTMWGTIWYISTAATIFLVALLSITRTLQIVCPFRRLQKSVVIGVIVGYLVVLLVQSTVPMWIGETYRYEWASTGNCAWRNSILGNSTAYHVYTQVLFMQFRGIFQLHFTLTIFTFDMLLTMIRNMFSR